MPNVNRVPSAQQPLVDTGSWTATQAWFRFFEALGAAGLLEDNDAPSGFVPTLIASGETFTVPANRQALFAAPIQVDGDLVIDGELIEVS